MGFWFWTSIALFVVIALQQCSIALLIGLLFRAWKRPRVREINRPLPHRFDPQIVTRGRRGTGQ